MEKTIGVILLTLILGIIVGYAVPVCCVAISPIQAFIIYAFGAATAFLSMALFCRSE